MIFNCAIPAPVVAEIFDFEQGTLEMIEFALGTVPMEPPTPTSWRNSLQNPTKFVLKNMHITSIKCPNLIIPGVVYLAVK